MTTNTNVENEPVELLRVKVNRYATLKAICTRPQSSFEMHDLENRESMVKFDGHLVAAEADLRAALALAIS